MSISTHLNATCEEACTIQYNSKGLQHPTRQLFSNLFSVWAFWLRRSTSCCCLRNRPISRTKKQRHRRVSLATSWHKLHPRWLCHWGVSAVFWWTLYDNSSSQLSKTFVTLISFEFLGYPWCLPIDSSIAGFRSQPQAGQLHQRKQEVLKTAESHSKIF